ncbi:hypothetical protein [Methylobacter psychrophilus]|uniref:hypothetical protein n=1 Tax=Methylobacter psychrophilus TaxID=96941 RepID=UPI0021D4F902|nr:hypothetical protein [Methylobacter psychrophilus]
MPLKNIENHTATQCSAMAKHTKQRCLNLAAYGMNICRFHGAHRKIISGKDCHFYKHGKETRAARKARPAENKNLRELTKLALSDSPIMHLPETDIASKVLNAQMEVLLTKPLNPKKEMQKVGLKIVKDYLRKKSKPITD